MQVTEISKAIVKIITPEEQADHDPLSGYSILHPEEDYILSIIDGTQNLLIKDVNLDEIEYLGRFLINSVEKIRKEKQ